MDGVIALREHLRNGLKRGESKALIFITFSCYDENTNLIAVPCSLFVG
ncbi:hypothetical protein [Cohnella sp.]